MNSKWYDCTLDDVLEFKNGKSLANSCYIETGEYPVWGSNGMIAHCEKPLNYEPVIVIGRVGAYCGSINLVTGSNWVTDNAIYATAKEGNDLKFLYYLLISLDIPHTAIGSAQPLLTQSGLKVLKCKVPPLETQREIAHILGTLDDKIELNRKMNKTLEEIAQTLYKHWFIDFEFPNEEGKPYKSSSGEMIDSELGLIPKGWRVGTIGDLCTLEYGKALVSDSRQLGKFPVMGSNGQIGCHNEAIVKGPGVVVGRKGNPGTVTWVQSDFFPIDTAFFVKQTSDNVPITFVYYCLLFAGLERLSADSAVPGLNRTIAIASKTIIPETKHMVAFDKTAQKNKVGIRFYSGEIESMACIRSVIIGRIINKANKELS